jgi:hypothetical protein
VFTSPIAVAVAAAVILAILVAITISLIRFIRTAHFQRLRASELEDSLGRKWDAAMAEHGMDREGNLLHSADEDGEHSDKL